MVTKRATIFFSVLLLGVAASEPRSASVHEVQPTLRDVVTSVWINGPAHSGKLGKFPTFGTGSLKTDTQCTTKDDKFTGYDATGSYCERASDMLDQNAHLLLASGRLGLVIDARGLDPSTAVGSRKLFLKLGKTSGSSPRKIYENLPSADHSINFKMTCHENDV